jgi:hypothetical protein
MNALPKIRTALLLALFFGVTALGVDANRPFASSELISPAELNTQLPEVKGGKVVLIQVGFRTMYKMAHIPGSQYSGAASTPEGLDGLKKLVAKLPRYQAIVIYCGCCPWKDCPNIRPAFRTLKEMGFANLKVLDTPTRLGDDWTAKGFPIVTGE